MFAQITLHLHTAFSFHFCISCDTKSRAEETTMERDSCSHVENPIWIFNIWPLFDKIIIQHRRNGISLILSLSVKMCWHSFPNNCEVIRGAQIFSALWTYRLTFTIRFPINVHALISTHPLLGRAENSNPQLSNGCFRLVNRTLFNRVTAFFFVKKYKNATWRWQWALIVTSMMPWSFAYMIFLRV